MKCSLSFTLIAMAVMSMLGIEAFVMPITRLPAIRSRPLAVSQSSQHSRASSFKPLYATSEDKKNIQGLEGWDPVQFVTPAFHNKLSVRTLAVIGGIALAVKQSGVPIPKRVALFAHLLSFGANIGAILYTTFVLGIVAFKNLPRQTFGKLQSKLFPIYFSWSTILVIVQLATAGVIGLGQKAFIWLAVSLFGTLLNSLVLEPKSTKIMFARYKLQDEGQTNGDEYKALGKEFGKYHGMSSLVNMLPLVGAFAHAWFLTVLFA